jgi:hypothetical protein
VGTAEDLTLAQKDRIARVKFEIAAVEELVGEAVRARGVVEAKNPAAKKFLEDSVGAPWIQDAVKSAMER